MKSNLVSPRARWRRGDVMAEYDRLPRELRLWLADAALAWSAGSALRLWQSALRRSGSVALARAFLAQAEEKTLAREAAKVWGAHYPAGPYCGRLAKRR